VLLWAYALYDCKKDSTGHVHSIDSVLLKAIADNDLEAIDQIVRSRNRCKFTFSLGLCAALQSKNTSTAEVFLKYPIWDWHEQEQCVEEVLKNGNMKHFRLLSNVVRGPFGICPGSPNDADITERWSAGNISLAFEPKGQILTELLKIWEQKMPNEPIIFNSSFTGMKFFTKATGLVFSDTRREETDHVVQCSHFQILPRSKLLRAYLDYSEEQHYLVSLDLHFKVWRTVWEWVHEPRSYSYFEH
jgi:hypothetical protein